MMGLALARAVDDGGGEKAAGASGAALAVSSLGARRSPRLPRVLVFFYGLRAGPPHRGSQGRVEPPGPHRLLPRPSRSAASARTALGAAGMPDSPMWSGVSALAPGNPCAQRCRQTGSATAPFQAAAISRQAWFIPGSGPMWVGAGWRGVQVGAVGTVTWLFFSGARTAGFLDRDCWTLVMNRG